MMTNKSSDQTNRVGIDVVHSTNNSCTALSSKLTQESHSNCESMHIFPLGRKENALLFIPNWVQLSTDETKLVVYPIALEYVVIYRKFNINLDGGRDGLANVFGQEKLILPTSPQRVKKYTPINFIMPYLLYLPCVDCIIDIKI
ncbi:hypothetical protein QTP88_011048 [Uroleucon formosanum]